MILDSFTLVLVVARLFPRTWVCPLRIGCTLYYRAHGVIPSYVFISILF
ncbi:hypothetical protein BACCOPRO_01075 [Phocaeicola coprophilus DSM 18228 = JCM 13818]|uniref:Uncharacterized protein n=1 Tax=Phocaeicola coprophilus DSM 18228 = JCM 13818 TaxID=547042 RepID=S0F6E4_9BACT|nr:hypothetical protein BACCOPRO_01075 [Phocaeicola coprophilus DSM 18228 = JCM 13818]